MRAGLPMLIFLIVSIVTIVFHKRGDIPILWFIGSMLIYLLILDIVLFIVNKNNNKNLSVKKKLTKKLKNKND